MMLLVGCAATGTQCIDNWHATADGMWGNMMYQREAVYPVACKLQGSTHDAASGVWGHTHNAAE